jgi:HEAT repeat protein
MIESPQVARRMPASLLTRVALIAGLFAGVSGCGGREEPPDVQTQIDRLQGDVEEDRWTALSHLQSLGGDGAAAVPELRKLLARTKDDTMRAEIAKTIGCIGPEAGVAAADLMPLLDAKEGWVRYCAAQALGKVGPSGLPALPKLVALSKGRDRDVAAVAGEAARRLDRLRKRKK